MLYRDVERRLDMQLTLSMEQQHPIFPMLEREMDTIPLDSHGSADRAYIDLFICGKAALKLEGVLLRFSPSKMGDCSVVRIRAEEMGSAFAIMDEIGRIDLAVRGGLYLNGGKIYADYRFASSARPAITAVGKSILNQRNSIRISDMGPSSGGISTLDRTDSRIPLGVVSYEVDLLKEMSLLGGEDQVIEYNFSRMEDSGFRCILYDGKTQSVVHIKSSFLEDVQKLSVERKIPKAAILARPVDGRYRSFTFLPYSMVDDQVSVLYEAAEKHTDLDFRLNAIRRYSREVWEWI